MNDALPRGDALRFGLWYVLAIGSLGTLHPFLAVALGAEGMSPGLVAGLLALFPVGLLASGPLFAALVERSGRTGPWLRAAATGAALSAAAMALVGGPVATAIALGLFALLRAPLFPLVDSLVLGALGRHRHRYGRLRLWGSLAFIVAVQVVGAALTTVARAPQWATAALMVGCALLARSLPEPPAEAAAALRAGSGLWREPALAVLWPVATLMGLGTSMYDFLFAVHLGSLGGGASLAAVAMGSGVAVEVAVMAVAPALVGRFGALPLIIVAAWVGVVRWVATATLDSAPLVAAVQSLHGLSFGLFWVAAVSFVGENAPPGRRTAATAMLLATNAGLGPLLAMPLAGAMMEAYGTKPLFWSSAACFVVAAGWAILGRRRGDVEA